MTVQAESFVFVVREVRVHTKPVTKNVEPLERPEALDLLVSLQAVVCRLL